MDQNTVKRKIATALAVCLLAASARLRFGGGYGYRLDGGHAERTDPRGAQIDAHYPRATVRWRSN